MQVIYGCQKLFDFDVQIKLKFDEGKRTGLLSLTSQRVAIIGGILLRLTMHL